MRHFNQDPLENFFGGIRSHGYRNTSPSPAGFEAAFASLLITNISNYSRGSNCEEDFCQNFDSMKNLLSTEDQTLAEDIMEIDLDDINCEFVGFSNKKRDPKIYAQISYVSGYILRQAKSKIFYDCSECKTNLYHTNDNEYIMSREYLKFKRLLTHPSEELMNLFSDMQDIINNILENKSNIKQIKSYCKTIIYTTCNFNFLKCDYHNVKDFIVDLTCRFFIFNWCRDVNKLLNGTRIDLNVNDKMKTDACEYYKKHNKNH